MLPNILTLWSEQPVLSLFVLLFIAMAVLYAARKPAHEFIHALSRTIHNAMRIASRSVMYAEKRLAARNKEVLLAAGEEAVQRIIEREFYRINSVVARDLSGYPTLQHKLKDHITRIDEDYTESTEVPPSPPAWLPAIEAVAKIPPTGDTMVAKILEQINKSLNEQHKIAIDEYRKAYSKRHSILKKMMPFWRKMSNILDVVDKTMAGLLERSKVIDSKMEQYEDIRKGTDKAVRMLSSSSLTQFCIAGFVLLIAIGGAVINFNLIALPMSEMVGGGSYIGPFKTSNVAAMVIIMVEATMGLFLMESLRITKLFPIIGSMEDKMRTRMIWVTFSILFILAAIESSLAYMRDMIAADVQALRQTLADVEVTAGRTDNWIPTVGQMVMGFILPFALAFVAIPLESFVHASRTVMGIVAIGLVRGIAFLLRLIGNISRYTGETLIRIYDLFIFAPLWIERLIHTGKGDKVEKSFSKTKEGINSAKGGM